MTTSPIRYRRLVQALPRHNYKVKPAAIEAGFTPKTADKQGKRLLKSALKQQAKDIIETMENDKSISMDQTKQLMRDIVGLSREDVMNSLKIIATNTRDYASALKVLGPLAKQEGVVLQEDERSNVTVPILNVTMASKDENKFGLVEPSTTPTIHDSSSS